MPDPALDPAPIACSLGQDDLAGRQRRWHALADHVLLGAAPTEYGLRMRFRAVPGVEAELLALAALEADCCSFADWTVSSEGTAHVMEVRGSSPAEVAAVQAMFTELRAPTEPGSP